jgi:NuA3 HAT complex component NTO1
MAPSPSSSRRSVKSASTPRGPGRPRSKVMLDANGNPPKKRRYIPGGPGGGGRYVDEDGNETPVGGTGPGGYAYSGQPRKRPIREPGSVIRRSVPRPRREKVVARPRYSSAAAAAAAAVQGDSYKPREEKGWEEFHPALDIEAQLQMFNSEDVDGVISTLDTTPPGNTTPPGVVTEALSNGLGSSHTAVNGETLPSPAQDGVNSSPVGINNSAASANESILIETTPARRPRGRPARNPEHASLGSPLTPLRRPDPAEKLNLNKPSFRRTDPFSTYEQPKTGHQRYVDRAMASVGYQESDIYIRPENVLIRVMEGALEEDLDLATGQGSESETNSALGGGGVGRVEYDMDEQDDKWLSALNAQRRSLELEAITREVFEITITKIEKEWHALEKRKQFHMVLMVTIS